MNRIDLLRAQLDSTYDQEDWYPPLQPALTGLTAEQASWRPAGEAANTIWENVNHLLFYRERLVIRLQGGEPTQGYADNDATFAPGDPSPDPEAAWQAAVRKTEEVHRELKAALSSLSDGDLERSGPNGRPIGDTVMAMLMHDAYHTGQIVQIRKMQGSWSARRSFE